MENNVVHADIESDEARDSMEGKREIADLPSAGPGHVSGHASHTSFTRTIGQDVDWGEDDEVNSEWNIQSDDADPFQLMPTSDRTNSFPPVPPAHTAIPETASEPAAHIRANETLEGSNDQVELEPIDIMSTQRLHALKQSIDWGTSFDGEDFSFGTAAGGDLTEEDANAGQYDEGIPLVGGSEVAAPYKKHQKKFSTSKVFADDEDDFFSAIKPDPIPESSEPPIIHRKSTAQVLGSMHYDPQEEFNGANSDDEHGRKQSSSKHMSTGGEIAVSKSTLVSQVTNDLNRVQADMDKDTTVLSEEELAAKWQAALDDDEFLDDDDDFLPDDTPQSTTELDPATLFGSDDEGFLDDDDEPVDNSTMFTTEHQVSPALQAVTGANGNVIGFDRLGANTQTAERVSTRNRYLPAAASQLGVAHSQNPYAPPAPLSANISGQSSSNILYGGVVPASAVPRPSSSGYQFQPQIPEDPRPDLANKAQSFANKTKGGYSSPYDLPMDVTKPRKRVSMQQMSSAYAQSPPAPVAPPRGNAAHAPGSQLQHSPPVITSHQDPVRSIGPTALPTPSAPPVPNKDEPRTLKSKGSFFEELPVVAKPRLSRPPSSHVSPVIPGQPSFSTGPPSSSPPSLRQTAPPRQSSVPPPPATHGLVSPPIVSPYAPMASQETKVAPASKRYSPAPTQQQPTVPVPAPGRYTATPPLVRQTIPPFASAPLPPNPPFAHQPRTSSPLAHFQQSLEQETPAAPTSNPAYARTARRESSSYSNSSRDGHMPLSRELIEQAVNERRRSYDHGAHPQDPNVPAHYLPNTQIPEETQPVAHSARRAVSYAPDNREPIAEVEELPFQPPLRSRTQSPGIGGQLGRTNVSHDEPYVRPSSVQTPLSPPRAAHPTRGNVSHDEPYIRPSSAQTPISPPRAGRAYAPVSSTTNGPKPRTRGFSQSLNYIAPTDGRQNDNLQRWRGCPVFFWGAAGTVITSFPKEVPRYVAGSNVPMIQPSPGEVKIRNIKDIYPLEGPAANFPGPLKGKSKKKEIMSWLSSGIDTLNSENGTRLLQTGPSHDDKRREERVLLWRILRVFIEHDGVLEGNVEVQKSVRAILSPDIEASDENTNPQYNAELAATGIYKTPGSQSLTEPVDAGVMDEVRKHLLRGDREKAVWTAVDNRLWAHAMLIAHTFSADLYKRVAQEFIQKEVKQVGENAEPLAALYEVFAGNHDESVDELVPPSARAGFQMVTASKTGPSKSAVDGLNGWRETLSLILSNRSVDDNKAIHSLGKLLAGYGRAEAAHICFMFARSVSVFAGVDDPNADIVLIGAEHQKQPYDFENDLESIELTEVYEYGLSLCGASSVAMSVPHLAVYKLQHAKILAGFGLRTKALDYCESIATAVTSQTKRSSYHHTLLMSALDDLIKRLKQSPKDEPSSWISKPSMDKVSSSVWTKFNKFVAGDDNEDEQSSGGDGAEAGPFARIAGGTPTISRSPSVADIYGQQGHMQTLPADGAIPIPTGKTSRYAPSGSAGNSYNASNHLNGAMASSYGSQYGSYGSNLGGQPSPLQGHHQYAGYDPRVVSTGSQDSRYAPTPHSDYQGAPSKPTNYLPSQPEQPQQSPQEDNGYASITQDASVLEMNHSQPPKQGYEEYKQPRINHEMLPPHISPQKSRSSSNDYAIPSYGQPSASSQNAPSFSSYQPATPDAYQPSQFESYDHDSSDNHETPPTQSYAPPEQSSYASPEDGGYTPPTYEPNQMDDVPESPVEDKPKKKSFMDDDDDDEYTKPTQSQSQEKTKAEKDREADEAFRKAAEEDAKRAESAAPQKKGWGLTGWFAKKDSPPASDAQSQPGKPIKAKLGEASSFYYDPELKRWVNKKGGKEEQEKSSATPPPPKGPPRGLSAPPGAAPGPTSAPASQPSAPPQRAVSSSSLPPPGPATGDLRAGTGGGLSAPSMQRSVSNQSTGSTSSAGGAGGGSAPPSRPTTSMSNASSIDDLLGPPVARKAGDRTKKKRGGRYIDVMGDKAGVS